jgi:hypothetical protein
MAGCSAKITRNRTQNSFKKPNDNRRINYRSQQSPRGNQTFLNSDGGDITLISIEDDKHVKCASKSLKLQCEQMTLKQV